MQIENGMNAGNESIDFDELESLFGSPEDELAELEKTSLTENLEGFASCFPDWDSSSSRDTPKISASR